MSESSHTSASDDSDAALEVVGLYDIDNPAPELVDEFPLEQQVIHEGFHSTLHAEQHIQEYEALPSMNITLQQLRSWFEASRPESILKAMTGKRVKIEPGAYLSPGTSVEYGIRIPDHFLDFRLLVPSTYGFSTFLPKDHEQWSWMFTLDLRKRLRPFKNVRGSLGMDPTGSMLYMGDSPTGNSVFLAMAPPDFFTDAPIAPAHASKNGASTSCMSTSLYRKILSFLAFCLNKVPDHAFSLANQYSVNLTGPENWGDVAPFLYVFIN